MVSPRNRNIEPLIAIDGLTMQIILLHNSAIKPHAIKFCPKMIFKPSGSFENRFTLSPKS